MIDEERAGAGVAHEPGIDGRPIVERTSLEEVALPKIVERIRATFDEMERNNPEFRGKPGAEINDAGIIVQRESGGDVIFYQPQAGEASDGNVLWIFHTTYPTSNPNLQVVSITLENASANDLLAGRVQRWTDVSGDWRNQLRGFSELDAEGQTEARTLLTDALFKIDQQFNQTFGREVEFDQTQYTAAMSQRYGR